MTSSAKARGWSVRCLGESKEEAVPHDYDRFFTKDNAGVNSLKQERSTHSVRLFAQIHLLSGKTDLAQRPNGAAADARAVVKEAFG